MWNPETDLLSGDQFVRSSVGSFDVNEPGWAVMFVRMARGEHGNSYALEFV